MRNFEEDWDLVNSVNEGLYIYRSGYENGAWHGISHDLSTLNSKKITQEDIEFVKQARKMILYYMNKVKQLEEELYIVNNPDDIRLIETSNYDSKNIDAVVNNDRFISEINYNIPKMTPQLKKFVDRLIEAQEQGYHFFGQDVEKFLQILDQIEKEKSRYQHRGLHVWRLNECDWVCAEYYEDAVEWYMKETGLSEEEAIDEQLSEHMIDLNTTMRIEDDPKERITFKDVIEQEYKNKTEPWIIASTEY